MDGNNATVGFISWVCWHWFSLSATIGFLFLCKPLTEEVWLKAPQVIFQVFAWARHQAAGVKVPEGTKPLPLEAVRIVHYMEPGGRTQLLLSWAICCGSHMSASTSGHEPRAAGSRHKPLVDMESERSHSKAGVMLASWGLYASKGRREEYRSYSLRLQQGWKQRKTNILIYSKPLLHGDTIKYTACEAKTKLCKITDIHMMSSVGRSANPDEIHAIQITCKNLWQLGWKGIIATAFCRNLLVCTTC